MGSRIVELAGQDERFQVTASVTASSQMAKALRNCDAVIDFSAPSASAGFAEACAAKGVSLVIGTTGFNPGELKRVHAAAARIPVLMSPNMSPAANLMFHLARLAARVLKNYDAAVCETHHRQKKDAPSGTAKRLSEAVGNSRGGQPAPIISQRIGSVIGDHTLTLAGPCERLELTHRAQSRDVFALGSLEAALWIKGRGAGLYDMLDVMGLQ